MKNVVRKQHGFTLLELVVVVAVLGLIASMATEFVTLETNQTRFNTTKDRLHQIRYAIVGDDSRSLNGQPTLSGYVTHTGQLPTELRQLFMQNYCEDPVYFTEPDCSGNGSSWETQGNWQGPYLQPTAMETITDGEGNTLQIPVFRDAWGNVGSNGAEDFRNYGWDFNRVDLIGLVWTNDDNALNLKVQSYGLDGAVGIASASSTQEAQFEAEYPPLNEYSYPLITENDYLGGGKTVSVSLKNESGSNVELCLDWTGVAGGQEKYLTSGGLGAASTANSSVDTTMGYVAFSLSIDTDSNNECDDAYAGEVEYEPSSTIAVHQSVPSNIEITLK